VRPSQDQRRLDQHIPILAPGRRSHGRNLQLGHTAMDHPLGLATHHRDPDHHPHPHGRRWSLPTRVSKVAGRYREARRSTQGVAIAAPRSSGQDRRARMATAHRSRARTRRAPPRNGLARLSSRLKSAAHRHRSRSPMPATSARQLVHRQLQRCLPPDDRHQGHVPDNRAVVRRQPGCCRLGFLRRRPTWPKVSSLRSGLCHGRLHVCGRWHHWL
jgi:hypothetical protein